MKGASAEKRQLTLFSIKAKMFCSTFLAIFHIYAIYLLTLMVLGKNSDFGKKRNKETKFSLIT